MPKRALSCSTTRNSAESLAWMFRMDMSNSGRDTGSSEKCSSVFGPADSCCELGAVLDWELGTSGLKTESASSSSSIVSLSSFSSFGILSFSFSSFGVLYQLTLSVFPDLVFCLGSQFGYSEFSMPTGHMPSLADVACCFCNSCAAWCCGGNFLASSSWLLAVSLSVCLLARCLW